VKISTKQIENEEQNYFKFKTYYKEEQNKSKVKVKYKELFKEVL